MYGLPEHANYYPEMVNLLEEKAGAAENHATVTVGRASSADGSRCWLLNLGHGIHAGSVHQDGHAAA